MLVIALAVSMTYLFGQENNVERPYYTTAEMYKAEEGSDVMKFYRFENKKGILKFIITDSTVVRQRSETFSPVKVKSMTFKIVSKERVDLVVHGKYLTKDSYTLEYRGSIYYFQFYEGHLNEIMWQTPSGILRLMNGDIIIDFKDSGL